MIPIYPTTNYPPMCHMLQTTWSPTDLRSNTSFPSPVPSPILIWACGPTPLPGKSWTPQAPCPSHPHHPPCHPHTTPPCHHCCFLLSSLLHTPVASHAHPSSRCLHPPCKVLLQPINELAGLILKWEALLQLKYFSDIPQMSGRPLDVQLRVMDAAFCIIRHLMPNLAKCSDVFLFVMTQIFL